MPKRKTESSVGLPGELKEAAGHRMMEAIMNPETCTPDLVPATHLFSAQSAVPAKSFMRTNQGWDATNSNQRPVGNGTLLTKLDDPFMLTDEPLCYQRLYQRYPGGGVVCQYDWENEIGVLGFPLDVEAGVPPRGDGLSIRNNAYKLYATTYQGTYITGA